MTMLIENIPITKEKSPDLSPEEELKLRAPWSKVPARCPTC